MRLWKLGFSYSDQDWNSGICFLKLREPHIVPEDKKIVCNSWKLILSLTDFFWKVLENNVFLLMRWGLVWKSFYLTTRTEKKVWLSRTNDPKVAKYVCINRKVCIKKWFLDFIEMLQMQPQSKIQLWRNPIPMKFH